MRRTARAAAARTLVAGSVLVLATACSTAPTRGVTPSDAAPAAPASAKAVNAHRLASHQATIRVVSPSDPERSGAGLWLGPTKLLSTAAITEKLPPIAEILADAPGVAASAVFWTGGNSSDLDAAILRTFVKSGDEPAALVVCAETRADVVLEAVLPHGKTVGVQLPAVGKDVLVQPFDDPGTALPPGTALYDAERDCLAGMVVSPVSQAPRRAVNVAGIRLLLGNIEPK